MRLKHEGKASGGSLTATSIYTKYVVCCFRISGGVFQANRDFSHSQNSQRSSQIRCFSPYFQLLKMRLTVIRYSAVESRNA